MTITDTQSLIRIAKKAGKAILQVYYSHESLHNLQFKEDNSPITLADQTAHKIIAESLSSLTPVIPIISEEGEQVPYGVRKGYSKYWLVDPLDGTKEFINRNGEFTVNIALVENNQPIQGFIYVPVTGIMYYTYNKRCYKESKSNIEVLKVNNSIVDREIQKFKTDMKTINTIYDKNKATFNKTNYANILDYLTLVSENT